MELLILVNLLMGTLVERQILLIFFLATSTYIRHHDKFVFQLCMVELR